MATTLSDLLNAVRIGRSVWAIIELGSPSGSQCKAADTDISAALSVLEGADPDFEIFL
jgi:hypothetical protein